MERQHLITLITDHYDTFWHGDLDDFDTQLSPSFVDDSAPEGTPPGPEPVKAFARMARAGCSDMQVTIEQAVVEGDVVAVRARWQGTHDGVFMGHPPTGQRLDFEGMVFWRIDADGRIAHRRAILDSATMARQLTTVPA